MIRICLILFFAFSYCLVVPAQSARVISENANLRGTPNSSGLVVETVSRATAVQVLEQRGAWFLVQTDRYVGWIHGNTIQLTRPGRSIPVSSRPDPPLTLVYRKDDEPGAASGTPAKVEDSPLKLSDDLVVDPNTKEAAAEPEPKGPPTAICKDGTYSYGILTNETCIAAGGIESTISRAGASESGTSSTSESSSGNRSEGSTYPSNGPKTVHVRGYTKKNGTYVAPHMRSAPHSRH